VAYAAAMVARSGLTPVVVVPKRRSFILLQQFYSELFPVAVLIAAGLRFRSDLVVIAVHLSLFPGVVMHGIRRLSASTANTVVNASDPHHGGFGRKSPGL